MTIEDQLRDAVAPRAGSDPAVEERVRREAMAALSGMRRRHRVRRVVSIAAGAAGVAAIAGFFVFAMPRGGDRGTTAAPVLRVSLLERPGTSADRLAGDLHRIGVRGTVTTVRLAGGGGEEGGAGNLSTRWTAFHAIRTENPGQVCLVASAVAAVCNTPETFGRTGALMLLPRRVRPGVVVAFLVPDGVTRVAVGTNSATVADNLGVVELPSPVPTAVTFTGPAATDIRPDGGPDWQRGNSGGTATVTVPFRALRDEAAPLTAGEALRLSAPAEAAAGSVVDLRAVGPDGLLRDVGYGIDATFERRVDGAWRPWYQLTHPLDGGYWDGPPPAALLRPEGNGVLSIGFSGGGPMPVRLPSVPPGAYRITKVVGDGVAISAEIRLTADPVPVPASAASLVDIAKLGNPATGPGSQRAWEGPPRDGTSAADGTRCWVVSAPGVEGGVCADVRKLARDGAALLTVPDQSGDRWGFLFAAPQTVGTEVNGRQVPLTNGVAFLGRLGEGAPRIRLILRSGAFKTFAPG